MVIGKQSTQFPHSNTRNRQDSIMLYDHVLTMNLNKLKDLSVNGDAKDIISNLLQKT